MGEKIRITGEKVFFPWIRVVTATEEGAPLPRERKEKPPATAKAQTGARMKPSRIKARETVKGMAWAGRIGVRIYRRNGAPEPVSAPATADTGPVRTITALVLGDPLPGRSALDRRRAEEQRHG